MKEYIGIEIGNSAYTEFKIEGEFKETCDGIYLGKVSAKDKIEAEEKIKKLEWNLGREFDSIVIYEILG